MELLEMTQKDKTLHLSNCEIPVAFGFQVLPLYRLEWIVSWNLPGGRSGLRRTQSIWQLGARIKTAYFPPFLKLKFTQLASTAGRDTPNIY